MSTLEPHLQLWSELLEAIILQGFENHRGWTAAIERQSGGLTLSSTGADVGFIIFGNCAKR
jgi:hypothetical protein